MGAPYGACDSMSPNHYSNGRKAEPFDVNPGFEIRHDMCQGYQANQLYKSK